MIHNSFKFECIISFFGNHSYALAFDVEGGDAASWSEWYTLVHISRNFANNGLA